MGLMVDQIERERERERTMAMKESKEERGI